MTTKENLKLLVEEAQSGSSESFGKIYDLLVGKIYRFVYFKIGKKEEAEDLTENIFLKAWENLKSFQDEGLPFEAWIYRIARNLIIDNYRTQKKSVQLDAVMELEDNSLSPLDYTELRLNYESALKALEKLSDSYKEIIILKFIEEKTNEEISNILQKPISHIRVLQNRAIKKLREVLKND